MNGTVTVTRSSGGREVFTVTVIDDSSRCVAFSVSIAPSVFADALVARTVPCEFEMNLSGVIGAIAEHKTELVPFDAFGRYRTSRDEDRTAEAVAALEPFEIDGWRADADGLWNPHNRSANSAEKTPLQRVHFRRYLRDGVPIQFDRSVRRR